MTLLPGDSGGFNALNFLLPEENNRLHYGSGWPACIDFMHGEVSKVKSVLQCTAVETKPSFHVTHMKQLSAYINKLAIIALKGLLFMEDSLHLAFSPFMRNKTEKAVPITHLSSMIPWRNEQCVSSAGLLLISMLHLINMKWC